MKELEPERFSSLARGRSLLVCAIAYLVAAAVSYVITRRFGSPSPIFVAASADLVATLVVFAGSMVVNNSSLYDPYWSLAPLAIALYWTLAGIRIGGRISTRVVLVLFLLSVWGIRLTWNWVRRWRGLSHEDWRYSDYRSRGRWIYWTVSFFGFHFFPTVLVFLGCLSLYPVLASGGSSIRLLDGFALVITAGAIWIETVSDRELRSFVKRKDGDREVLESGLWAYSRHPNYFGEVLFWWGLYLFALAANPGYWWAIIGPFTISLLFMLVSVPMMERHMSERHAGYEETQSGRSPLFPWFNRGDA